MPTVLFNNDYLEVRYVCYTTSQVSINVCHYRFFTAATDITDQEVAAGINANVANAFKANMPNEARFRGVGVRVIKTPAAAEVFDVSLDGPGTSLGDLAPTQVSGIITKRTALVGRKHRGRLFIGFPSNLDITQDGAPTTGYVGGLNGIASAIGPVMNLTRGGDAYHCDMTVRSMLVPAAPVHTYVASLLARNRFGTQRSRGQYGAQNVVPW